MKFSQRENLWLPYTQMKTATDPIDVVSTEGVWLTLADGTRLIDGIASWWTACHGYNHPHIIGAITDQAAQMPHVMMGGIVHQQALKLSRRLCDKTLGPESICFLSESGSVAVEVALKMAVQYWLNQGVDGRKKFACFEGAYHGDTTGAMSVCDPEDSMHAHFKGFLLQQYQSVVPETNQQRKQFTNWFDRHQHDLAGVIIEPLVQMAAGMRMHSVDALNFVARECQQRGLILIADEIATGFGRTGSLFAFQQTEFTPDIMCVGKGLTGGTVPLAATITASHVYAKFHSGDGGHALMHGPTFTGHAIGCAAANASLDLFEPTANADRLQQVAQIANQMSESLSHLNDNANVADVRVKGGIGVVQMKELVDVGAAMEFFRGFGVFIRPLRDAVYLAPSFTIAQPELRRLCDAVTAYVNQKSSAIDGR